MKSLWFGGIGVGGVLGGCDYSHVDEPLCSSLVGGKQSLSVLCGAEAEAAVSVQVFDVRSKEERLGVRAGAGTDGGRV